jgi:dTDP-4-amino-4,6-dideoxygalactose transaminase
MEGFAPLPRLRLYTSGALYGRLIREMATRQFSQGREDVRAFETAVAERLGGRDAGFDAIAAPMARVGIYLTIKKLIRPGANVVMSPYTIADVVNMVIAAGGRPVFGDVHPASGNLRADEVARLIDRDTGAVLATHIYGCAADITEIARICRERDISLVEDAAQAFGCTVEGRPVGTFGDAGIFSFGMYKNVNAFYGGMVVTRDARLAQQIRREIETYPLESVQTFLPKLLHGVATDTLTHPTIFKAFSFWFFRWAFIHEIDAVNSRLRIDIDPKRMDVLPTSYKRQMSPGQARALLPQLKSVQAATEERVRKAALYFEGLDDVKEVKVPPAHWDGRHIYMCFPVKAPDRRRLVRFMLQRRADIAEGHHRNCADLPCFEEFARECPVAREVANSTIFLPTYPQYADKEIARNISLIREFYGHAAH